jgi:CRP-like cAMP-binding protein
VTARYASSAHISSGSARLASLGAGDFFGEIGLLDGPERSATVTADSPMRLLVTGSRQFAAMMHSFPVIAERVRAAAAARVGATAEA